MDAHTKRGRAFVDAHFKSPGWRDRGWDIEIDSSNVIGVTGREIILKITGGIFLSVPFRIDVADKFCYQKHELNLWNHASLNGVLRFGVKYSVKKSLSECFNDCDGRGDFIAADADLAAQDGLWIVRLLDIVLIYDAHLVCK